MLEGQPFFDWKRLDHLQVVGGATGGGILVREGEKLASAELPQRLATGAIIRQKDLFFGSQSWWNGWLL